tara:strand:- start:216 stop:905 length:690 start_codon:yes stop_codon:yes gene_type:complete
MSKEINVTLKKGVFKPTGTSDILIKSTLKHIKKPSKILDLGCGSGYVGITIDRNSKHKTKHYFSDISNKATNLTKKNLKKNNMIHTVKAGSLFKPWANKKFDIIVNDVSGISSKIAKISPWYKNKVPYNTGLDGTDLTIKILDEASDYLNKKGFIIFPLISLCDYKKIKNFAKKKFKIVKKIASKTWPLPAEMYRYKSMINTLNKKKKIFVTNKFGLILFKTDIYIAKN